MKKTTFIPLMSIIVTLLVLVLVQQSVTFAKSENSSKSEDSNKGSSVSEDSKSNRGQGSTNDDKSSNSGKSNQEDNSQKSGKNATTSNSNSSGEKVSGKKLEDSLTSQNRGSGKSTLSEIGEDATKGAKLKKVEKVSVKEATTSAQGKRRAVQGIISSVSTTSITLTHQIQRDRIYTVLYNSLTFIKSKDSSSSATLQSGLRVAVVGDLNENGVLVAKRIHIIPGKATGIFKRNPIASSSATPFPTITATPSATLTPSPTATSSASF